MAAPATPAAPPMVYQDGLTGFGSRFELFCYGGTANPSYRGWYACESINPNYPGKLVERPNVLGGPNGFGLSAAQERGTVKAQLPSSNAPRIAVGDWFVDTFDPSDGTTNIGLPSTGAVHAETWVVETAGQKFEMSGYWYQDLNIIRAHNPPS